MDLTAREDLKKEARHEGVLINWRLFGGVYLKLLSKLASSMPDIKVRGGFGLKVPFPARNPGAALTGGVFCMNIVHALGLAREVYWVIF